jgi:RNA polymerase sigma-70 factor (ECF subfamily)
MSSWPLAIVNKLQDFYARYKDSLFGYLLRKTGNYQLSADIMQESFLRYMESYEKDESNAALLFTISRNLLVDQFRKFRPESEFDERLHYNDVNQEEEYMIREESRRVLAAIQQLDKDDADILALVVGSNLSYQEIGEITNMSEGNIRIKIHRSRVKLKKILGKGNE